MNLNQRLSYREPFPASMPPKPLPQKQWHLFMIKQRYPVGARVHVHCQSSAYRINDRDSLGTIVGYADGTGTWYPRVLLDTGEYWSWSCYEDCMHILAEEPLGQISLFAGVKQ